MADGESKKKGSGRLSPNPHNSAESLTETTSQRSKSPQLTQPDIHIDGSDSNAQGQRNVPPERLTRSNSHSSLTPELSLKLASQLEKLNLLRDYIKEFPQTAQETSLCEIEAIEGILNHVHSDFMTDHALLTSQWPAALLDANYFSNGVYSEVGRLMLKAKRLIGKLKSQFMPSHSTSAQPALDTSFSKSTLPVIKLPDFTGEYTQWPAFKEAFTSLILHDRRLTDSDRLHYLRGCLTGEPKQIISGLPSTGSSLLTALELLTARYSNKRLLIQTQLDRLYNTSAISHKNAASLNQLLSTWSETITLLQASASNDNLWEFFAVHQLMGKLDKTTHEQWETTMGSSQEFPEYSQLVEFLTARARAWERLSQTPAQSTTHPVSIKTAQKKTSSSHVTTQETPHSSSAASYPCDCCNGAHFVVACPSHRHLTPSDRNKIVIQRRLCFNCLGRHNVRLCKSTQSCKVCRQRHHSMLHAAPPTQSDCERSSPEPTQR